MLPENMNFHVVESLYYLGTFDIGTTGKRVNGPKASANCYSPDKPQN